MASIFKFRTVGERGKDVWINFDQVTHFGGGRSDEETNVYFSKEDYVVVSISPTALADRLSGRH